MMIRLHYSDKRLFGITSCISLVAFLYFYLHGQQNLSYYDAIARLNTARKMIDSITPGIGQLGGIWLPFPQMLMLPFIWNDFLWHSGIAGYIISGASFVIGAVYLQKAAYILTNSRKIALIIWFLFVTNINVLLLQTMAMSEVFFFCFLILTCYYLTLWLRDHYIITLLQTAFCIMVLTLTRYEGYFVFFGVMLAIIIESVRVYTLRNREKIEGMLLVFLTVAGFGIILWCIYSGLFYKDPLFWLHAYTPSPSPSVLQDPNAVVNAEYGIHNPNLLQSLMIYSSVIFLTNGIITVLLGAVGFLLFCLRPVRSFFSLWLVSSIMFLLLVVGYYKGFIPHIEYPPVFLTGENKRIWSIFADNNMRYGIIFLPCILLFVAFTATKSKFLFYVVALFVLVQLYFSITNPQLFQYTFDHSWTYPKITEVPWFRSHYHGGLILIAASRHEDFMFQTGLPYKDFIYEGTRNYWNDSLIQPSRYATWVIYNDRMTNEDVAQGITQAGVNDLKKKFTLVYKKNGYYIYELQKKYRHVSLQ